MGAMRNDYNILVGNLEGRDYLEDVDVDGKMIYQNSILENRMGKCVLVSSDHRTVGCPTNRVQSHVLRRLVQ
jgi:hypothetical protein